MFFFFNDTATTEIYTLSLHDALPICTRFPCRLRGRCRLPSTAQARPHACRTDRKSTRLNSSHDQISYAVFCLKKKKQTYEHATLNYTISTQTSMLHTYGDWLVDYSCT